MTGETGQHRDEVVRVGPGDGGVLGEQRVGVVTTASLIGSL
ncbi:MAG: hypothetical protein WBF75_01620 [Pseudonocardiaceae bacterium]